MLLMVLNDGETFTGLRGAAIVELDDSLDGNELDETLSEIHDSEYEPDEVVFRFEGGIPPIGAHVLAHGNPVDGFSYKGPFQSDEAARKYGEGIDDSWWIIELEQPS